MCDFNGVRGAEVVGEAPSALKSPPSCRLGPQGLWPVPLSEVAGPGCVVRADVVPPDSHRAGWRRFRGVAGLVLCGHQRRLGRQARLPGQRTP